MHSTLDNIPTETLFSAALLRYTNFLKRRGLFFLSLSILLPFLLLSACHPRIETTLSVRDNSQEYIPFDYAFLHVPYVPTDSLTAPQYHPATGQTISFSISEPTFISVRTTNNPQPYLLLLSPNERAELQIRSLGYTVKGSSQSMRICELNDICKSFNDTIQHLKHRYEWLFSADDADVGRKTMLNQYDSLVSHTRLRLIKFIAKEPLSKVNLLALEMRYNGRNYIFTTPSDRTFAREIAKGIINSYSDTLLATKVLREYTDEQ